MYHVNACLDAVTTTAKPCAQTTITVITHETTVTKLDEHNHRPDDDNNNEKCPSSDTSDTVTKSVS
jgi:hypothetical protein